MQLLNIPFISLILIVLKLLIPFISFNWLHSSNILLISVTFTVLKLFKFKYSKDLHKWNIAFIFVTLLVINLFIPKISFNLLQSSNIPSISVTLVVSKLDKSKYSNSLHEQNTALIYLTLDVLNLLIPFICFKLVHS